MTKLLQRAYKKISLFLNFEQDIIAKCIIEKIKNIGLYKAMLKGKKRNYVSEEEILKVLNDNET